MNHLWHKIAESLGNANNIKKIIEEDSNYDFWDTKNICDSLVIFKL